MRQEEVNGTRDLGSSVKKEDFGTPKIQQEKNDKPANKEKVFVLPREQHRYPPFQRHDLTNYLSFGNLIKLLVGKASEAKPKLQDGQPNLLPSSKKPGAQTLGFMFFKKLILGPILFILRICLIAILFAFYILYLSLVQTFLKLFGINLAKNWSENKTVFRMMVRIFLFAFGIYRLKHRVLSEQEFDVIWKNHLNEKIYSDASGCEPPTFKDEERVELQKKIGTEVIGVSDASQENSRIKKEPFITISNHLTVIDPLILMAVQGEELSFLVKEDAQHLPLLGWILNLSNCLFLGPNKNKNKTVLPAILTRSLLYYYQTPENTKISNSNLSFFKENILKSFNERRAAQKSQKMQEKSYEFEGILDTFNSLTNPSDTKNYLQNPSEMKDFLERECILFQKRGIHPKIKRMMVFPEATTTAGTHFIDFYKGGLTLGVPIKPCVIMGSGSFCNLNTDIPLQSDAFRRSGLPAFNQGWIGGYSYIKYLYHFLTEFQEEIEIVELPPLIPNKEELRDGMLWCKRVRMIMMETANYMKQMKRFQNADEYLFVRYEEWLKK